MHTHFFSGNQTGYEIDEVAAGGVRSVVSTAPSHGEQIALSPGGTLYANDQNGVEKVGAGGMLTTVARDNGTDGYSLAFDASGTI